MTSHSESLRVESYIRGYCVCQRIWNPAAACRLLLIVANMNHWIVHNCYLSRPTRSTLGFLLGLLCCWSPPNRWQRHIHRLKKGGDFSTHR